MRSVLDCGLWPVRHKPLALFPGRNGLGETSALPFSPAESANGLAPVQGLAAICHGLLSARRPVHSPLPSPRPTRRQQPTTNDEKPFNRILELDGKEYSYVELQDSGGKMNLLP